MGEVSGEVRVMAYHMMYVADDAQEGTLLAAVGGDEALSIMSSSTLKNTIVHGVHGYTPARMD